MAEPQSSAIGAGSFALIAASIGPAAAEWTFVLVGGFLGACLAATSAETIGLTGVAKVLLRGVITSALFSAPATYFAAPYFGANAGLLLLPIAGLIGWHHDKLSGIALDFIRRRSEQ